MTWIIYQIAEYGHNMYITHVEDGAVGKYSGIQSAYEFQSIEQAQEVLEWLNDPATFYSDETEHFIKELK